MGIEWFRDLIICIFGVIAIAVLILIGILSYLLYQRSKVLMEVMHAVYQRADSILDAMETTTETIRGISSSVTKAMLNPITQIIATVQGIRQGINVINKVFKKKEEEKENE
jgi:hypothetical protein